MVVTERAQLVLANEQLRAENAKLHADHAQLVLAHEQVRVENAQLHADLEKAAEFPPIQQDIADIKLQLSAMAAAQFVDDVAKQESPETDGHQHLPLPTPATVRKSSRPVKRPAGDEISSELSAMPNVKPKKQRIIPGKVNPGKGDVVKTADDVLAECDAARKTDPEHGRMPATELSAAILARVKTSLTPFTHATFWQILTTGTDSRDMRRDIICLRAKCANVATELAEFETGPCHKCRRHRLPCVQRHRGIPRPVILPSNPSGNWDDPSSWGAAPEDPMVIDG